MHHVKPVAINVGATLCPARYLIVKKGLGERVAADVAALCNKLAVQPLAYVGTARPTFVPSMAEALVARLAPLSGIWPTF